jgi:hypothetical protein
MALRSVTGAWRYLHICYGDSAGARANPHRRFSIEGARWQRPRVRSSPRQRGHPHRRSRRRRCREGRSQDRTGRYRQRRNPVATFWLRCGLTASGVPAFRSRIPCFLRTCRDRRACAARRQPGALRLCTHVGPYCVSGRNHRSIPDRGNGRYCRRPGHERRPNSQFPRRSQRDNGCNSGVARFLRCTARDCRACVGHLSFARKIVGDNTSAVLTMTA